CGGREGLCIHSAAPGREATMPHVIAGRAGPGKRVVIVGAGPAGLESARVAGERGHAVVLFEAAEQPGGQVRLAARAKRRRELIGIVDWRLDQLRRRGVEARFNTLAEAVDVLAEKPDVVVIATGGLPNTAIIDEGADLVIS